MTMSTPISTRAWSVTLVLLAAAGTLALTMGTRQTMGLFLGSLNTNTGLGLAASAWPSLSASCGGG